MTRPCPRFLLLAVLALVVLPLSRMAGQTPAGAAPSVRVNVRFEGEIPKRKSFEFPPGFRERRPDEAEFCGKCADSGTLRDESLEIDAETRGVANVAIAILGPAGDHRALIAGKKKLPPVVLDNASCRFAPHVGFVMAGSPITVRNSDSFSHNARIVFRGQQELWNAIVAPGREAQTRPFNVTGTYTVYCDVHPWMRAYIIAVRHPYVEVTGKTGECVISDLPIEGEADVVAWHETLGSAKSTIRLVPGSEIQVRFTEKDLKSR